VVVHDEFSCRPSDRGFAKQNSRHDSLIVRTNRSA